MTDNTKGGDLTEKFKGHLYLWHEHSRHIPNRAVFNIIKEIEQVAFERGRRVGIVEQFDEGSALTIKRLTPTRYEQGFRACREKAAAVPTEVMKMMNDKDSKQFRRGGLWVSIKVKDWIESLTPDGGSEK